MTVLFDNKHIKEYPQAKCVGLRFDYPYDQSLYPFVGFNGPDALFDAPKIYTIAYGDEADKNVLTEIANRTNGRLFVSNPDEIAKTYRELSANF